MEINISEAKAQLSKLINLAYHGEKIVICKNNLPLVDLVRHKPEGKRKLGLLAGKFVTPPSFFKADHEIEDMFYGNVNTIITLLTNLSGDDGNLNLDVTSLILFSGIDEI